MADYCKLFGCSIMKQFWIIAISCMTFGNISKGKDMDLSLPENFKIGAGSAAYQIEGAWNVDGKGVSIWDRITHRKQKCGEGVSDGDIAANFYYKYKEDVQNMKFIGFYKNLTAELVANGIEPVVTLYHWDHPQVLEDMGGWTNEMMSDWYVWYAESIFEALGDNVKIWATFNEPNMYCTVSYEGTTTPIIPENKLSGVGQYFCMHNILKAHARTYHMYNKKFRATQQGAIGITPECMAFIPVNSSDTESAETAYQFLCGWVLHPIFNGDYPEIMKKRIAKISKVQGYKMKSRLPEFSQEWISLIKGTIDYVGLNYYTSLLVTPDPDEAQGIYNSDDGLIRSANSSWPTTAVPQFRVTPSGIGTVLRKIRDEYNNPPVWIMENGFSNHGGLDDYDRIRFHYDHFTELLKAMKEDKCNVMAYSIWALMDDFEWISGYTPKFGIFEVDFNDVNKTRTMRLSGSWWKSVMKSRQLQPVPTTTDSPNVARSL